MLLPRSLIPATGASLGIAVVVLDAVFLFLAAVALAMRVWSRRINGQALCLNDYLVIFAWPFTAGLVVTAVMAVVTGGAGQHMQNVHPLDLSSILKGYVAAELLWTIANSLIKFSILHLYVQVFTMRGFRKVSYAMMVVVASFMLGLILTQFLICRPFAKNWEPLLAGTCGDSIKTVIGVSVINVCVDLTIIVLPMPVLWRLQMATKRKVALSGIFGLGTIICVITILRVVAAVQFNMLDFTYDLAKLAIWTDLEPTLGMINACLPVMQPALRRIFGAQNQTVSRSAMSSSAARLRTESTRKSKFRQLDDSYALTDTGATKTYVSASGEVSSVGEDLESYPSEATVKGKDGIRVQRKWQVTSEC